METVKKAYAEMILNTAKEAAARVMASEQKALKFQQDLQSTKEEAVRMLLRLKLMIDSKTTEAESLSQNQQKRIDELQAQLDEAEGLIIDLRAELHDVHEQLNAAKRKPLHYLIPHAKEDLSCRNSIMAKSNLNNSESLKFPTELGSKVCKSADMSDIALCNYSKDNNLNEPEIFQNGRCALAMSLADERLYPGDNPSSPTKINHVTDPNGGDAGARIMPSSKAKKVENLVDEDPLKGHASKQQPYTFRGKRRRKARYSKTKNSSCKVRCNKLMLSQRSLPAISHSARFLHKGTHYPCPDSPSTNTERKNVAKNVFVSGKEEPQNKGITIAVARRSIRKRRVKYMDISCPPLSHSSLSKQPVRPGLQCPSFPNGMSNAVECTVKSTKLGSEGIEEGTGFRAASSDFFVENKICKFACADNDAHEEDKELIDVSVMEEEDDGQLLLNFGMLPVESVQGDTKSCAGSKESNLQGSNMTPLKYTFSRKRKKDNLLNPNENSSPDFSVKKRSIEIENIDPRLQDSKVLKDLPFRSNHLVQVAHQLISLSGRSW